MENVRPAHHGKAISKNARVPLSEIALKLVMAENFWAGLSGYLRLSQPAPRKNKDTGSSIKDVEDDSKRKSRFLATLGMTVRGTLAVFIPTRQNGSWLLLAFDVRRDYGVGHRTVLCQALDKQFTSFFFEFTNPFVEF